MAQRSPHVVIVQRFIRQYRVPFFEALKVELGTTGIDLSLVHNTPAKEDDPRKDVAGVQWAERGGARSIKIGRRTLIWQHVPRWVWEADLVVVEQATQFLLNYALLARRRLGGPMVGLWGHGVSPYHDANRASEAVKRIVSREPDWWFAYTDGVVDRVRGFGFPADRITSVRNAIDTRLLADEVASVTEPQLEAVRGSLGLQGKCVGLFVGALIPEKRLSFVVAAGEAVKAELPDFELVIAGAGPLEGWVEDQAARHPWLFFAGQRFGPDLAALMRLSTLLFVPAWVGLVITDSFAAGTPLIASASAEHPPEIYYLRHRENGLLVEDGGDPRRYAEAVVAALEDQQLLDRMVAGCRVDTQLYSVEDMARRFADGVSSALSVGPRRRRRRTPERGVS